MGFPPDQTALLGCPKALPLTQTRLSLGSAGSWIGSLSAGTLSAAPTLSTPKPVSASQPGRPTSRALRRTAWTTRSGVSSGRAARTHAIAAETIGAEKLVPESAW